MHHLRTTLLAALLTSSAFSQTNTFPTSGNVGIGTTNPVRSFGVGVNDVAGFTLDSPTSSPNSGFLRFGDNTGWKFHFGRSRESSGGPLNSGLNGTLLTIQDNGNVGIGTTSPGTKLDVNGDISLPNHSGRKQIYTWSPADSNWRIGMNTDPGFTRSLTSLHVQYITYAANPGQGFAVGVNHGESSFEVAGDHRAFFRGNVGIGETNPQHKLAVNGTIKAKEVIVETTGWSDYVFADDYRLAPLAEVEAHIKTNKHLPGIPSAAQVAESGVNLGDVQAALLAKVEELTLHLIAQEKKITSQQHQFQAEISRLQARVRELEAR